MNIEIRSRLGPRLQSEPKGRKDFASLCELLAKAPRGSLVTLNFTGVETATASWWSAAILPLLRMASNEQTDLYFLIVGGLGSDWLDDLRLVAKFSNQSFLVAGQNLDHIEIVGPLDDALRRTLALVQRAKVTTGAKLASEWPDEKVRPTAWNNRLRDLNEQRLLRRTKRGREQLYSPVVEVMLNDG